MSGAPEPEAENNPTVAGGHIDLPRALTSDQILKAVEVIETWEASRKSACELIADLYPVLVRPESHR